MHLVSLIFFVYLKCGWVVWFFYVVKIVYPRVYLFVY